MQYLYKGKFYSTRAMLMVAIISTITQQKEAS